MSGSSCLRLRLRLSSIVCHHRSCSPLHPVIHPSFTKSSSSSIATFATLSTSRTRGAPSKHYSICLHRFSPHQHQNLLSRSFRDRKATKRSESGEQSRRTFTQSVAANTTTTNITMSKRSEHPTSATGSHKYPELRHPSTKRAKEVDEPNTDYDQLTEAVDAQDEVEEVTGIAHWFRSKDLRIQDNVALQRASKFAQLKKVPLVTFYLWSNDEFEWHGTSPARTDFIRHNLEGMQAELKELHIPLVFIEAKDRKAKGSNVQDFLKEHKISHLFANYEYEIDEVRRDLSIVRDVKGNTQVALYHDQTIMEPGSMTSESGKPQKVFTPYHKHWLSIVANDPSLLDSVPTPEANDASASKDHKDLFDTKLPAASDKIQFSSKEDAERVRKLWPSGHSAGVKRLEDFLKNKVGNYAATRSNPAKDSTSRLSPYFAAGVISIRETLTAAKKANGGSTDFSSSGADAGIASWVRELCFRELYRQQLIVIPHNSMNLPQNLKFNFVQWEDDEEGWKKWCDGTTGMPFVDAGMRQLKAEAYMHNRLRMNVSSYLYCNLLLDYRRGERFFAENLIDWDLANNTQGWEPSYTVFNPVSQAEKNDPDGDYIRQWVPELRDVKGKAVFDPHARLPDAEFRKLGYPAPHVDWKETKQRAMERFKNDMSGVEP